MAVLSVRYPDCDAGRTPVLVRFLACLNSWCHPPAPRAIGREYAVGTESGIGREN